ncbi:MAG: sigma-70 family RNA polymerase sigma factor [Planctomycetes bacterium]|nr:sigma-70 family RNA polymerase sigma factor [Planctomycetota bacterium]
MPSPLEPGGEWARDLLPDEEVVRRVCAGEKQLFELLVRRHNPRLYRAVRALVRDDHDAEEALQLAYVRAWRRLATFDGRARFTTWMTRIALRTGLEVSRQRARGGQAGPGELEALAERGPSPHEQEAAHDELSRLLERSLDALPRSQRLVFVLRVLEGQSTGDVARALELTEAAVKVRLMRARERLRRALLAHAELDGALANAWHIGGERCDRIVAGVFRVLALESAPREAAG